jgi:hypothetical protein
VKYCLIQLLIKLRHNGYDMLSVGLNVSVPKVHNGFQLRAHVRKMSFLNSTRHDFRNFHDSHEIVCAYLQLIHFLLAFFTRGSLEVSNL